MKIRKITKKDFKAFYKFQITYLDEENYEDFLERVNSSQNIYLGAFENNELEGIIYGHPSKSVGNTFLFRGVAVNLDKAKFTRKGVGSKLVSEFEKVVRRKGMKKVELGCADDLKVEKFYLKNGYSPVELVAKDDNKEYARVKINDYGEAKKKQEKLRKKYNAKEVIFIFEKKLK